ncbi:COMPASS component SWD2 [Geosmithia morbida]|uniref:COMPASS component SWD2 n=1 Tax=Geosmithia morbida TaxID=1094350 RepID=A0A9P4YUE0_9HYPO|nr:COMPASS component SWD2 [Geosmithia morbida]KAF4123276.1 COMPASS component SWD2 [Geosmithia morbida]
MSSTPMDLDRPAAAGTSATFTPSLNIHRTLGAGATTTTPITDIISTFRPTKLFRRDDIKDDRAQPHVQSIDYNDDGDLVMTAASDETIQIYNVKEGRHEKSLLSKKYGHEGTVTCLAVHPGNDSFISCSQDNTVRIWDTQTKNWQGQLNLRSPTLAAHDPSGTVFAVACPSAGTVLLYDARNFDRAPFATVDVIEQVRSIDAANLVRGWTKLDFSNDGNSLLLGTNGNGHFLLDAFDGSLKAYLRKSAGAVAGTIRPAPGDSTPTSVAIDSSGDCCFTPDGRFVISGASRDVLVWDVRATPNEHKMLEPTYTLNDKNNAAVVAFNPRYNFFATADQELAFWLPDPHS